MLGDILEGSVHFPWGCAEELVLVIVEVSDSAILTTENFLDLQCTNIQRMLGDILKESLHFSVVCYPTGLNVGSLYLEPAGME